jgi:hypothetical protein
MDPVTVIGVLFLIYYVMVVMPKSSDVDAATATIPGPPSEQPETTVIQPGPDMSYVPNTLGSSSSMIELYTEKNFKGIKIIVRAEKSAEFALRNGGGGLVFKYQSMKLSPGTMLMFTNEKDHSGSSIIIHRGFAIGKYNVPDMHMFLKSNDSLYRDDGILMSNDWNHNRGRQFRVMVLTDRTWHIQSIKDYDSCLYPLTTGGTKKAEPWMLEQCKNLLPDNNRTNITGFTNRENRISGGC